jgi:hypothetical protein
MKNDVYSVFYVTDYKGGDLICNTNLILNEVLILFLEFGSFKHELLEYQEDIFDLDEITLDKVIKELEIIDHIYSGGGNIVFKVFKHNDNKLEKLNLETLRPFLKDIIL